MRGSVESLVILLLPNLGVKPAHLHIGGFERSSRLVTSCIYQSLGEFQLKYFYSNLGKHCIMPYPSQPKSISANLSSMLVHFCIRTPERKGKGVLFAN